MICRKLLWRLRLLLQVQSKKNLTIIELYIMDANYMPYGQSCWLCSMQKQQYITNPSIMWKYSINNIHTHTLYYNAFIILSTVVCSVIIIIPPNDSDIVT